MSFLTALVAGLLFGAGLMLSGMANPAIVLAFLDVAGTWNPALAFTMAGAIAVAAPVCFFARRRQRTLWGTPVHPPGRTAVDARLVGGSALFGVGWGLTGICPGPALLLATGGQLPPLVFVAAMAVGMVVVRPVLAR